MRVIWAVLCLCWCAIVVTASSGAAATVMSADQAVSIAEDLAHELNLPLKGAPKTELLDPNEHFLTPPSWDIRFDSPGRFQVDATTGQMLAFQVSPAAIRKTRARKRAISQGQAVEVATKTAEAMGLPADAVLKDAALMSVAGPADVWSITWERRTSSGILFYDDALTVYLQAASGQPTSGYASWSSRMPESMEVKVSEEQAEALALRFASKRGPLLKKPTFTAELRIVHPNGHWTSRPVRSMRYDSPTRLAWVVEMERRSGRTLRTIFWIDAADGSLLGGAEPVIGPAARPAPW
jgi:hypothetical protein